MAIHIVHHVTPEGLHVRDVRSFVPDAVKVIERQLNFCLVGDR